MSGLENQPPAGPGKLRPGRLGFWTILSGLGLWLGLVIFKAAFAQTTPHMLVMMIFSASMIVLLSLVGLAAVFSRLIKPPPPAKPPSSDSDQ